MGNILSDGSIKDGDMNAIWKITQDKAFDFNDPIWTEVFEVKGYLQSISKSHLHAITTNWSREMSRKKQHSGLISRDKYCNHSQFRHFHSTYESSCNCSSSKTIEVCFCIPLALR